MKIEDLFNNNPNVYKEYPNYPAHLIIEDEDDVPIFTIGTGGSGKTFNMLKKSIDHFRDNPDNFYNQVGMFFPTKEDVKNQIQNKNLFDKLLSEDETADEYRDFIANLVFAGDWIYWKDADGVWINFCRLYALSGHSKYKPEDHSRIGMVWMDEYQRERYNKNESFQIQDLLSTIKRKKTPNNFKVYFTSNALSLAAPIHMALGIWKLDDDIVTPVYTETGRVKAKVVNWSMPWEQTVEQNNGDIWMDIFEESGYADYRYKNEFKNDSADNVEPDILKEYGDYIEYLVTIKAGELYLDCYIIPKEFNDRRQNLYWFTVNKERSNKDLTYTINREDVVDGIPFDIDRAYVIARKLEKNLLYYNSVGAKQAIWEALKKYFGY